MRPEHLRNLGKTNTKTQPKRLVYIKWQVSQGDMADMRRLKSPAKRQYIESQHLHNPQISNKSQVQTNPMYRPRFNIPKKSQAVSSTETRDIHSTRKGVSQKPEWDQTNETCKNGTQGQQDMNVPGYWR